MRTAVPPDDVDTAVKRSSSLQGNDQTSNGVRDSCRFVKSSRSDGLNGESTAERVSYFEDGCEAGIAVTAETLVQAFAADTGLLSDLCHSACLDDIADGGLLLTVPQLAKPFGEFVGSLNLQTRNRIL